MNTTYVLDDWKSNLRAFSAFKNVYVSITLKLENVVNTDSAEKYIVLDCALSQGRRQSASLLLFYLIILNLHM